MAASQELCDICEQRHVTKSSTFWCPECEQAFCDDCNAYHGFSKLSKHHVTVSIQDHLALSSSISQTSNTCMDHNEQYQMVCQAHDELLCLKCIEKHDGCKGIIPISKVIENVKMSSLFQETQKRLNDINRNIEMLQNELKKQQGGIKQQEETILSQISETRNKINNHLDKLEEKIRNEVSDITAKLKNDMNQAQQILEGKNGDTNNAEQQLKDIERYASDLQTYLGLRKISSKAATTELYLQSIIRDHSLDEITLLFKVDDKISNITNNSKKFGSVTIHKILCKIDLVRYKNRQAQLGDIKIKKSIADIKLNLITATNIGISDIRGIVVLPSGNIAISDYSDGNIAVFRTDWKRLGKISVTPANSFDVTYIHDKTIATTSNLWNGNGVNIIDIETERITRHIPTNSSCYGIIYHNGSLYVCASNIGILKLNPQDRSSTVIVQSNLPSWCYIEIFDNKIYYTSDESVKCYDMQGKQIWTFKDGNTLKCPRGLALDSSGNVYVACTTSHRVVVISPDGQQSRELLSLNNGLVNPSTIYFDRKRHCLLVANKQQSVSTYEIIH
ncbi:Hypothetical predicted protein [Mytilus galloprovincialis]|uniref:B box-type domain-containing protein n=2 Tax=Mytilus galloprovincialis TaxID=29158 RepID=A0A8B6HTE7_MYTGA|nr:Hypothetical predicted protein [Mytilus galloprovincialis]